jgi:hypothetical protein
LNKWIASQQLKLIVKWLVVSQEYLFTPDSIALLFSRNVLDRATVK